MVAKPCSTRAFFARFVSRSSMGTSARSARLARHLVPSLGGA
jgi:hypothetical protein